MEVDMSPFENLVDAIQHLSLEEKLRLRTLLEEQLRDQASPATSANDLNRAKNMIGLFEDEPELMDSVLEAMYERRSRPLRINP
jgi:hypothetical protein